jgi:hypothetical protein
LIKELFREKPSIPRADTTGIDGDIPVHTGENAVLIELLQKQTAILEQQLDIKDKQIEDLNLRLAESNAALVSAQQTIQAEQALHAGTIQSRLLTDGKEKEKISLWNKIFKKKNQ